MVATVRIRDARFSTTRGTDGLQAAAVQGPWSARDHGKHHDGDQLEQGCHPVKAGAAGVGVG